MTLSSAHPLHLAHDGVAFRRSRKVETCDTVRRDDGVRIARPTRLAFDLAANLDDRAHRSVVDQLMHEHDVDVHPSHLGIIGSTDDKRRDRKAALLGWSIVRLTALDFIDLEATADELLALHMVRCAEVAA